MATIRYTLRRAPPVKLDRDALFRALNKLPLETWAGRWQAAKVTMAAVQQSAHDPDGWLWAYGVWMALSGRELPMDMGPRDVVAEGYADGSELVGIGPLVMERPLGARRVIGSRSPGRCWLN
jgi:hypothetical protein